MPSQTLAVVIPAGGGGTRLWPRSRRATPKQFLDVVSERTMLQETADRVAELVPPERVFVITNAAHVASVRQQLPAVPPQNIVGEPEGRDSAPAIGLMAALLEKTVGSDAVMCVLPADHVILHAARFRDILELAATVARDGWLVTLGIPPTGPDTGFGYIQMGTSLLHDNASGLEVSQVREFKEKPDRPTAESYVQSGTYLWNAGMYIAQVGTLRTLFRQHLPDMEGPFAAIAEAYGTPQMETVMQKAFPQLPKISVDYGIAEKADKVAVVPASIGWNDVGSWERLAHILSQQSGEESVFVGEHIAVDSPGAFVYSPQRLVALVGLEDVLVIDTPDATLICHKSRAEDVKRVVDELKARGRDDLL